VPTRVVPPDDLGSANPGLAGHIRDKVEGFASSCVRIAASDIPIGLGFWLSKESTLAHASVLSIPA